MTLSINHSTCLLNLSKEKYKRNLSKFVLYKTPSACIITLLTGKALTRTTRVL